MNDYRSELAGGCGPHCWSQEAGRCWFLRALITSPPLPAMYPLPWGLLAISSCFILYTCNKDLHVCICVYRSLLCQNCAQTIEKPCQ